jgi:hypothetical protein
MFPVVVVIVNIKKPGLDFDFGVCCSGALGHHQTRKFGG